MATTPSPVAAGRVVSTEVHARSRHTCTSVLGEAGSTPAGSRQRSRGRRDVTHAPDGGQSSRGSSRHSVPLRTKPVTHSKSQRPLSQVPRALAGTGQGSQRDLQLAGEMSLAQVVPQAWWPTSHANAQAWLAQSARPLAGTGQRRQLGPHPRGEVPSEQAPLHMRNPAAQVNPHCPATQVETAFSGVGQGAQRSPQVAGAVLSAQRPSHAW